MLIFAYETTIGTTVGFPYGGHRAIDHDLGLLGLTRLLSSTPTDVSYPANRHNDDKMISGGWVITVVAVKDLWPVHKISA